VRLNVKLFASLREGRFDERDLEFAEGTRVREVAKAAGIPEGEVAVIFINARHAELETLLRDGDRLSIFPPVGGG
jgi:molybdopterin converting factor small subunit